MQPIAHVNPAIAVAVPRWEITVRGVGALDELAPLNVDDSDMGEMLGSGH
jgi:hypothetical protein